MNISQQQLIVRQKKFSLKSFYKYLMISGFITCLVIISNTIIKTYTLSILILFITVLHLSVLHQVGHSQPFALHPLNQGHFARPFVSLCPFGPQSAIDHFRQLLPSDFVQLNVLSVQLNNPIRTFFDILFLPFVFFFASTFSICSLRFLSSSAFSSASICSLLSRLIPPNTFGSIVIVSAGSFSSSLCTKASLFCFFVSKGLFSNESKYGTPAPGTITLLNPLESSFRF